MNAIRQALIESRRLPGDERQEQVRGRSSYVALGVLFGAYLATLFVYTASNQLMPLSTQVVFTLAIMAFAVLTLRGEGAGLAVPILQETKSSLRQPAAVRSLPWLIVVTGFVLSPIAFVAVGIQRYYYWSPAASVPAVVGSCLMQVVLTGVAAYWSARWIKEGRSWFMLLYALWCAEAAVGYGLDLLVAYLGPSLARQVFGPDVRYSLISLPGTFGPPISGSGSVLSALFCLWGLYVIIRYWRVLLREGAVYRRELAVSRS